MEPMNCTALVTDDSFEVWTSTQVAVGLATHALQRAWITEQVPQCGYCQSGQIMKAAELLASNPNPTRNSSASTWPAISAAAAHI